MSIEYSLNIGNLIFNIFSLTPDFFHLMTANKKTRVTGISLGDNQLVIHCIYQ